LGEYNHLHPTSNFGEPSPCPPKFSGYVSRPIPVEVIAKVPSRYYRVPRYFFTVFTVAHIRWYRPTLRECRSRSFVSRDVTCSMLQLRRHHAVK